MHLLTHPVCQPTKKIPRDRNGVICFGLGDAEEYFLSIISSESNHRNLYYTTRQKV